MSYEERGADCIDIVRQCVGEYVPGRAGTRSNCQRALDRTEFLLLESDAEIAVLRALVERAYYEGHGDGQRGQMSSPDADWAESDTRRLLNRDNHA